MILELKQNAEKQFFQTLNKYVAPRVEAGLGNPSLLVPVGPVVLETVGRKSGRVYKTPLLASRFVNLLLVSTVRGRSQWIKNLAANPTTHLWLDGEPQPVWAYVVNEGEFRSAGLPAPSPLVELLLDGFKPVSQRTGSSFAVLDLRAGFGEAA